MKTTRFLLLTTLVLAAGGLAHAFDPNKPLPRTEVVFFEPEKFADIRDGAFGSLDAAKSEILSELRTYTTKEANRYLAQGQVLTVTVLDMDLAGEFEPWRGAQWADVRVVKDIYPPRIKLAFKLVGADGQVIRQGDRDLRDLAFMMKLTINREDPRRYEKELINDWLRQDLKGLK